MQHQSITIKRENEGRPTAGKLCLQWLQFAGVRIQVWICCRLVVKDSGFKEICCGLVADLHGFSKKNLSCIVLAMKRLIYHKNRQA